MQFYIESKYNVDDVVIEKEMYRGDVEKIAQVMEVECRINTSNRYYIEYLVEYEDKTRKWIAEERLYRK